MGLHLFSAHRKECVPFQACHLWLYGPVHIQNTASSLCSQMKSLKTVTGVGVWKGRFAIKIGTAK